MVVVLVRLEVILMQLQVGLVAERNIAGKLSPAMALVDKGKMGAKALAPQTMVVVAVGELELLEAMHLLG